MFLRLPESEKIAKIGAVFIQDTFRLRFTAVIIRADIVKRAVLAAMQIRAANGAPGLSSGINIIRNLIEAFVTTSHRLKDTFCAEFLSSKFENANGLK